MFSKHSTRPAGMPDSLTRDVQHGVHVFALAVGQHPARCLRQHDYQFDLLPRRFLVRASSGCGVMCP